MDCYERTFHAYSDCNVYASVESGIKTKLLITTVSHKRCGNFSQGETMPNFSKGLGCGVIVVTKPGGERNLNVKICWHL